jgi:uncharacterized protein (DUF1330 family)
MAKGYLIAHIRVHDKDGFEKLKAMSGPVISEYGGKVLVRDPNSETREGGPSGIVITIEFESIEDARKFYEFDKYSEVLIVRESAAETNLILVEGI